MNGTTVGKSSQHASSIKRLQSLLQLRPCMCANVNMFTGSVEEFLTGVNIEPFVSLLCSLLNRNNGVDKQGRPGECGKLSE